MSRNLSRVVQTQTAFFLCDMQEVFRPNVKYFPEILENCKRLLEGGKILNIPLVVTEQVGYPKGLQHTVQELDTSHAAARFEKTIFSMVTPENDDFMKKMCNKKLKTIVLFGVETHVCILHTALDLLERNYDVHVVADGCSSRSLSDRALAFEIDGFENLLIFVWRQVSAPLVITNRFGGPQLHSAVRITRPIGDDVEANCVNLERNLSLLLQRLKQAGCIMTSAETVLMELLGSKDHPNFKAVQKLVLDRAPDTALYKTS